MKMLKKILVIAVALVTVFALAVPAYASVANQLATEKEFNSNSTYFVSWDWVQYGGSVPLYTEFADGLVWDHYKTGTGTPADGQINEVQKITVRTSKDGDFKEYTAYCAHVGSWAYSGNSYDSYVLDKDAKGKIVSAFNYIYDKYGSLDGWCEGQDYQDAVGLEATRVLAQMAVWYFIPPDNDDFRVVEIYAKSPRYAEINVAFQNVIAAGEAGYIGEGLIDLVYMKDSVSPGDVGNCQPQIIPIIKEKEVPVVYKYKGNDTACGGWVTGDKKSADYFPTYDKKVGFNAKDGVYRNGASAWFMSIEYTGAKKIVDLVVGQNTVIGKVIISEAAKDGSFTVTYAADQELGRVNKIHCGAYDSLSYVLDNKVGNGQLNGNKFVSGNEVKFPAKTFTGGKLYIFAHSEASVRDMR